MSRSIALTLIGLSLLTGASWLQPPRVLAGSAVDPSLTAYDRVPPEVALFSVALGGLNGLLVDYLWLRMTEQQDQGRYFEMVQTADWVAALQPNRGRLYAFQAWNLAYNISTEFHDPADRWRWVTSALQLLLQRGVVWNPDDPAVYESLARIIDDKVTGFIETRHLDYKRYWAAEWHRILGGPTPVWDELEHAPSSEQARAEPEVSALLERAAAEGVTDVGSLVGGEAPAGSPVAALLADPANRAALARLDLPVRVSRMKQFWRLDPVRMRRIDREYGPFDWRTGPPHSIYWITAGIEAAGGPGRNKTLERMLYQTLVEAFELGRIVYPSGTEPLPWPDIQLIPTVERAYLRVVELFPDDPTFPQSRRNFLVSAAVSLYAAGRSDDARQRYLVLRREYPGDARFAVPFEQFVNAEVAELARGNAKEVGGLIQSILMQAYAATALGDGDYGRRLEGMAGLIYRGYRTEAGDDPNLPRWEGLCRAALEACRQGAVPAEIRDRLPRPGTEPAP